MDGLAGRPGAKTLRNHEKPLSSGACRVFTALTRLAAADGQVTAKYDVIREASGCARGTIARALAELEDAGLIIGRTTNYKGRGGYAYTLAHSSISPIVHSSISPIVQPPDLVLGTGTGGGGAREFSKSPEEAETVPAETAPAPPVAATESPARQRARALLREFNIGEPTQTALAAALEPRFDQDDEAPATVRRICERTREDWNRGWARNPIGLTVTRIRRFVAGEQLSFLAELGQRDAPAKPGGARSSRGGRRPHGRRPQATYTAEQRQAVEAKAAERDKVRDDGALQAQLARAESAAQAAQDAAGRKYWTDYATRLRERLGERLGAAAAVAATS